MIKTAFLLVIWTLCMPQPSYAWGERGHHLIARVAARLTAQRWPNDPAFHVLLVDKEIMLGHLANIPDTLWRSELVRPEDRAANSPTHFVDLDLLGQPFTAANLPLSYAAATAIATKSHHKLDSKIGTAPWRIGQLVDLLVAELRNAKTKSQTAAFQALVYAGIVGHFIGDLGNPEHTTSNYDGWASQQGGLHAYFESDLVKIQDLNLDQDVYTAALASTPVDLPEKEAVSDWAFRLAMNSADQLEELHSLDRKYALVKPSNKTKKLTVPAIRRDPAEVAKLFRPLIVQRLAMAANVLAQVWHRAWEDAGRPDLQYYHSFDYAFRPDFIPVKY